MVTLPHPLPPPADPVRVKRLQNDWLAAAETQASEVAGFMRGVAGNPQWRALLDGIFGNSPYLSGLLLDHPATFMAFAQTGPEACVAAVIGAIGADKGVQPSAAEIDIAAVMADLRRAKAQIALLIALADIAGLWAVDHVTARLSDFADASVACALRALLRQAQTRGNLILASASDPETDLGYAVIGLGKLGGRELNYSSDIDLLILYDEHRLPYVGKKSVQEFAVQLAKDLTRMLQERTAQGYVFRTDLRLRPDSTAIAVSREAAQIYYESYGQNWERAAMIKARGIAGDPDMSAAFTHDLQPFIWRKSLDFYAIQDIHSIKRQIYAHKGGSSVDVAGHNIKLGRGGIREIEFFAQIQQLIWGGRFPQMRLSQTLPTLDALTALGFVTPQIRDDLAAAYRYLRKLEHRLQMIADEQTQTLPKDAGKLAHVAAFMGHTDLAAFTAEVERTLRTVEVHYAGLFEDSPSLAVDGNLVFTDTEDDPDTIATLKRLGYQNPVAVAQMVRAWHHGRFRATRSDRARQLLTEVMPSLLSAFGKTAQPDAAIVRFDHCLSALPAGVPLLSVFYANPDLLDLVAEIMGDAPRLAEHLSHTPTLLDYVLAPDFYEPLGNPDELRSDLELTLSATESFEAILDASRRWANDQQFRVGVQALTRMIDPLQAAEQFTTIAVAMINGLVPRVCDEFARQFGLVADGSLVILGYGKLGSFELTPTSDLDLVVIYDAPMDSHSAGGAKPLPAPAYYIRLVQRLITAFTLLTREGKLYELDLRPRPNGDKGPLASSLDAFIKYQAEDAWTWEHMALTRARLVYGPAELRQRVETAVSGVLRRKRDPAPLVYAVADMRARMRREQKDGGLWDLKRTPGGLIDAEFILQYLLLRHPEVQPISARPGHIIAALVAGKGLSVEDGEALKDGIALWSRLQVMLRLTTEGELPDAETPLGLKQKLAAGAGMPDFATLESLMRDTGAAISDVFARIINRPAEEARAKLGPNAPH